MIASTPAEGNDVAVTAGTRFNVGDKVMSSEDAGMPFVTGTVTTVLPAEEGVREETTYVVRDVPDTPDYHHVVESELQADTTGILDIDDLGQVYAELIATVTSTKYGLTAEQRHDRLHTLGRVSFLAGRAIWLEASAMQKDALAAMVNGGAQ